MNWNNIADFLTIVAAFSTFVGWISSSFPVTYREKRFRQHLATTFSILFVLTGVWAVGIWK